VEVSEAAATIDTTTAQVQSNYDSDGAGIAHVERRCSGPQSGRIDLSR